MICGLLGVKLGHSFSPQIHRLLGKYEYKLFEKNSEEITEFFRSNDFHGINVTIPYKKEVMQYCDELSPEAQKVGAVNTIIRDDQGHLIGHNTDYFGFKFMVKQSGLSFSGKKVLVLGSGGASNTVYAVADELEANVVVISRTGENNYSNLHLHSDCAIIVNTTPVGMYPNNGESPIDLNLFPQLEGVLDLIYNPACTQILLDAKARNLIALNGLWMLVAQAKESAEWFTNTKIDDRIIIQIHNIIQQQASNIVLIGMPGCGKSTIGKMLSEKCNKKFTDSDAYIEEQSGIDIPEIFAKYGENAFRRSETAVLSELGKLSGLIIATGGGCVTREENYSLLKQNGTIIWLRRDIDKLPTDGRPLSNTVSLHKMYAARQPHYQAFADIIVDNNCSVEETVATILSIIAPGEES